MNLSSLNLKQLERLYRRLDARMRHGNGYQPWGFDWPTLWAVRPELAGAMQSVLTEAAKR